MTSEPTAIGRASAAIAEPEFIPGYKIDLLIGKGGMGEVYKGVQLSLGRAVAVKLLPSEMAREEAFVARFEKEAAALASLSHPNIVSIVDKGKSKSSYYLVMEFVGGPSLREMIRDRPMEWARALRITVEVSRAIDYAHNRGIVHRDLKPENILFDEQAGSIPKVSDFGLASFQNAEGGGEKYNLTDTHVAMGTLSYMAPEQQVDAKMVDGRADIYSLGVMLYEMLVGEVPRGNFDPPSARAPGIDRRLDAIVARCLKPAPADRYQKVSELLAELEPLVPLTVSLVGTHQKRSFARKMSDRLAHAGRLVARYLAIALLGSAALVLLVSGLRARRPKEPAYELYAKAAAADLPASGLAMVSSRLEESPQRRFVALFEGSYEVPVRGVGRLLSQDLIDASLVFPAGEGDRRPGRATLEVVGLAGETAHFSASFAVPRPPGPSVLARAGELLYGEKKVPRAALMLHSAPGRYAAVVAPGWDGRVGLEWSLDGHEGAMAGPPMPTSGEFRVELNISRDGELRATLEAGGKKRPVGEPIRLGPDWRDAFDGVTKPAVACLAGACQFKKIIFEAMREPVAITSEDDLPTPQSEKGSELHKVELAQSKKSEPPAVAKKPEPAKKAEPPPAKKPEPPPAPSKRAERDRPEKEPASSKKPERPEPAKKSEPAAPAKKTGAPASGKGGQH